eukprot:5089009-Prymnesium_polylepis.1
MAAQTLRPGDKGRGAPGGPERADESQPASGSLSARPEGLAASVRPRVAGRARASAAAKAAADHGCCSVVAWYEEAGFGRDQGRRLTL